ncbi:hypothetical protein NL676_012340 [Syzygium grande]|nr:hypothetical protein NL676_012340 [Syzygium grande]
MMMGAAVAPPKPLKPQRAEYCLEVELGEAQWINCDIGNFRIDVIGHFRVIMADPPWAIHMELPYGTMSDDEMQNLNVPALQTDGLIFLWVTGRAMELGRECSCIINFSACFGLELWGYKRVEEIIWVKTNQLQRIIRTGRTGHWLNHSKEHCLVGIKGNPEVNRNIDTDVIVAEGEGPLVMYIDYFLAKESHSEEGLQARFKPAYPDVEVQPASPPKASVMEVDLAAAHMRSPFAAADPKSASAQFSEPAVFGAMGVNIVS